MGGYLIFVDTNIFLDLYRESGREPGVAILGHLDSNRDDFITTHQVEMEFKKNRQRVILESHGLLKTLEWRGLRVPAFLAASKQSKGLATSRARVKRLVEKLRDSTRKVLRNPTTSDKVYKAAQRLFRSDSPNNLSRNHPERHSIYRLARRRCSLGYPPRKRGDTSFGDAINWEWLIACASRARSSVIIVSRDSDYGESFEKEPVINDWLLQEFRDRVSRKKEVVLTDRLSEALRKASISVTKEEEAREREFLAARPIMKSYIRRLERELAGMNLGPSETDAMVRELIGEDSLEDGFDVTATEQNESDNR